MAYIAYADGRREEITDLDKLSDRDFLMDVVGGWIERVCPSRTLDVVFLCNEEGHRLRLPLNDHGCELYGWKSIVGDIVVMTRDEARKARWI